MNFNVHIITWAFLLMSLSATAQTDKQFPYAPSFRYCPDRDYDLAWENDLVAFRIYGKQPNPTDGLSGVDCWHKKVNYPILDKWYTGNLKESNYYHTERGEGCDQYHVGKTRGCGGVGIWKNNEILRSGLYESWEVVSQTQTTISFKVTYSWIIDKVRLVETRLITLHNGNQLYSAVSHFTQNGKPVQDLEIAIGLSTQNGKAEVVLNEKDGFMSARHGLAKEETGMISTGAIVEKTQLVKMLGQRKDEKDASHVLAIVKTDSNGAIRWQAGFAWDKAGRITSQEQWIAYLKKQADIVR